MRFGETNNTDRHSAEPSEPVYCDCSRLARMNSLFVPSVLNCSVLRNILVCEIQVSVLGSVSVVSMLVEGMTISC